MFGGEVPEEFEGGGQVTVLTNNTVVSLPWAMTWSLVTGTWTIAHVICSRFHRIGLPRFRFGE
jgi:hypothetical protein